MFSKTGSLVTDYAIDLLSRLHHMRKKDSERPLLFICHSLGGIVFKQALITASEKGDPYGTLLESIHAVIFMGTPHRGSRTAGPALHLSRVINAPFPGWAVRSELLKVLKASSNTLIDISRLSVSLMKDLRIVSFYEQKSLGASLVSI